MIASMAISVLIVDDESEFRTIAGRLLRLRGFEVAGQASDGAGALRLTQSLRPDAVLLDVNLPDMSGLEAARRLAAMRVSPLVLLTSADEDVSEAGLADCGAIGFVAKERLPVSDLDELFGVASEAER